jgi:3-hydroxyisobutyrate dehydrogenase-like beta-hydroxyacid dehydrogenase
MSHPNVSLLGLGHMGTAMAECFAAAGVPLTLWNRTPAKAFAFAGRAEIAPTAGEACGASDVIVLSLSNYSAGLEVLDDATSTTELGGKTLLQLTSGSASDARTMHAWARMHGLNYIDAAIVAYPKTVGTDSAVLFYAGDEAMWQQYQDTFSLLGGMNRFVGDSIGAAATLDCAVLEYYYGATLAMLHGAALCDSENFPLTEYFYIVKALAALLTATADNARAMIAKEMYAGTDCALDVHVAAIRHIQRMSHDNEIDTRVPDTIMSAYKKAAAAGYGDDEIAALFETLKHAQNV